MKRKVFYSENANTYPGIIARNNAVLEYEKFIHRNFYPYIIHPYSQFRVNWSKLCLVVVPVRIVSVSFLWAIFSHKSFVYLYTLLGFQILNCADVILNFFTGYIESDVAVLEPRRIVKRYLTTYFLVDFIPCLPLQFMRLLIQNFSFSKQYSHYEFTFDVLVHLVCLRYFSFLRYFRDLAKILLWNCYLVGMLSVFIFLFCSLMIAIDVYTVMTIRNQSISSWYCDVYAYLNAFMALLLDCLFYDTDTTYSFMYVRSVILVISFFSYLLFLSNFIKFILLKMTPKKFYDVENRVLALVKIKHLPRALQLKGLLYFQIILENKYYREDEIFNYIPDTYKADIFFHLCLPLLKHFYAFEELPTFLLRHLAECMKYQLCLPNEVIMKKDETRLSMYFVYRGSIALYSSDHVELYHFEGGTCFNGRQLILGEVSSGYYAISIEIAEIYRLDEVDFKNIMKAYPGMEKIIRQKVRQDKAVGQVAYL